MRKYWTCLSTALLVAGLSVAAHAQQVNNGSEKSVAPTAAASAERIQFMKATVDTQELAAVLEGLQGEIGLALAEQVRLIEAEESAKANAVAGDSAEPATAIRPLRLGVVMSDGKTSPILKRVVLGDQNENEEGEGTGVEARERCSKALAALDKAIERALELEIDASDLDTAGSRLQQAIEEIEAAADALDEVLEGILSIEMATKAVDQAASAETATDESRVRQPIAIQKFGDVLAALQFSEGTLSAESVGKAVLRGNGMLDGVVVFVGPDGEVKAQSFSSSESKIPPDSAVKTIEAAEELGEEAIRQLEEAIKSVEDAMTRLESK